MRGRDARTPGPAMISGTRSASSRSRSARSPGASATADSPTSTTTVVSHSAARSSAARITPTCASPATDRELGGGVGAGGVACPASANAMAGTVARTSPGVGSTTSRTE